MSGGSLIEKSSAGIRTSGRLGWREAAMLVGVGAAIVALNAKFRLGLRLPGYHGLDAMALLVIARGATGYRWAATVSSLTASVIALLPVWGFGDQFVWLTYLLPGPLMDAVYLPAGSWRGSAWFAAVAGALAHLTKPLARLAIAALTGWQFGSLLHGAGYPLAMHAIFGGVGGLLGAVIVRGLERK